MKNNQKVSKETEETVLFFDDASCQTNLQTEKKYKLSSQKTQISPKKSPNDTMLYKCVSCYYFTSNKKDYHKHLTTQKHLTTVEKEEVGHMKYVCCCGKIYHSKSGFWKHKKTMDCKKEEDFDDDVSIESYLVNDGGNNNSMKVLTDLVIEVVKQNQELAKQNQERMEKHSQEQTKQNQEFQKQIFTIMQKQNNSLQVHNQNSNNHTNSHNKFNLQFFLNETCKDALNISEFVDSVKISLQDLENVGSLGYVEGITKIILNNLKELDVTKRPIHCTDAKREIIHIKDNNAWEREGDEKPRLTNSIKTIAHKNILTLSEWKEAYPEYKDSECKKNDIFMKIVNESMGACDKNEDERNYSKIIKKIAKETTILP